jgi:hypothetical protein
VVIMQMDCPCWQRDVIDFKRIRRNQLGIIVFKVLIGSASYQRRSADIHLDEQLYAPFPLSRRYGDYKARDLWAQESAPSL